MAEGKAIAFFDFDGTLITRDSALDFAKYYLGPTQYSLVLFRLSLVLIGYRLGLLEGVKAKRKFFETIYGGHKRRDVLLSATAYWAERKPEIMRKEAYRKLLWHRENEHEIVIVSASADIWLEPVAADLETGLICTTMECADGVLSGDLAGANCNHAEKANRIRAKYDLSSFDMIYAYGDTEGDRAMLDLATEAFYRKFD